jgi:putative MATE family efflux protein
MAPLLAELALGMAMGWVGTALAARQGDTQAAAFALGHQVAGLLFVLLRVVGAGISVVVSQQLGAGQLQEALRTGRASVLASLGVGLLLAAAAALPAHTWMHLLQAPAEVAPAAAAFLVALAPALVLDAALSAQTSVLRAHLQVRATLLVNIAMQGVHLLLAWWWMPSFGLAGFAWAMLAARVLGVALAWWLTRLTLPRIERSAPHERHDSHEPQEPQPVPHTTTQSLRAVLHVGLPAAAENVLYRLCATVSIAVAGSLGAATLTAQAYAMQFNMLTMLPGVALGLSMEVLVGHAVGQAALRRAHARVLRALAMGLACSAVLAAAVASAGPWLLAHFTQDPQITALALLALWWTVLLEPGRTFNLVVINGLRAAGDTRFPVAAGAVSMVLVLGGGSWLMGQHLGLGIAGIWIAYAADEWIRGLIMWWRWQYLHWLPHARTIIRQRRSSAQPA